MPQKVIHFSSEDFSCPNWYVKRNSPSGLWYRLKGKFCFLSIVLLRLWLVFCIMRPINLSCNSLLAYEGFLVLLYKQISI